MNIQTAIKDLIAMSGTDPNHGIFRPFSKVGMTIFKMFKSPALMQQYANDSDPPDSALDICFTACAIYGVPSDANGNPKIQVPSIIIVAENLLADDWEVKPFEEPPRIIQPDIKVNFDKSKLHV